MKNTSHELIGIVATLYRKDSLLHTFEARDYAEDCHVVGGEGFTAIQPYLTALKPDEIENHYRLDKFDWLYRIDRDVIAIEEVRFVGNSFDRIAGGIEHNADSEGFQFIFDGSMPQIIALLLEAFGKQAELDNEKHFLFGRHPSVNILTLWSYDAWQSYEGEWDSSWQLIGQITDDFLSRMVEVFANGIKQS